MKNKIKIYSSDIKKAIKKTLCEEYSKDKTPLKRKKELIYESDMPNKYIGNNNIVYLKTRDYNRRNGGKGATYNLYWKGHQISGPFNFGTKKQLKDFADDFILSIQKYNKLKYKDEKPLDEVEEKTITQKIY